MNIRNIQKILFRIDEIKVIGKNVKIDGVICNVMGIVRFDKEMRLFVLLYDQEFQQRIEEGEEYPVEAQSVPESNRMIMRKSRKNDAKNPFRSVRRVFIDNHEFKVTSSQDQWLSMQDWEPLIIITKFLEHGWQPNEIEYQYFDMLSFASLKLDGDYCGIPDFNKDPELRFEMGPSNIIHQVEEPITLAVGGEYHDKIIFRDADTGEEHWVQINRIYLSDMWEEMEKVFSNPKLLEQVTSEQITQSRLNLEKHFSEICPRGMYLPVVEYECEDNITLQFYSRAFLDAKPVSGRGAMGFIIRPEQSEGKLGLKLKADVIQEPVPANTNIIEAEIFQFIHTTTSDDIVLK